MRVYLESTILTDWLFARTMKPASRKKLKRQVHQSHRLVVRVLNGSFRNDTFVTSIWAIFESVGNIKRSRIQFNMLTQNVNLGYYDAFKDKRGFKLEPYQIKGVQKLIRILELGDESRRLEWSKRGIDYQLVIRFIMLGLDPPDAMHMTAAVGEKCDIFVTRDRDFEDRKTVLNRWLEVVNPETALQRLQARRKRSPPIMAN